MIRESTPPGEECQVRCRKLGHEVSFRYCREESKGLPCFKIIDCWHDIFLIEDLLRKELTQEEWDALFERPPKSKILNLVELIEQAKRNAGT